MRYLMQSAVVLFMAAHTPTVHAVDFSISSSNPSYVYEVARPRPPGANTQWMSFWIYGDGFFGNTRHVAVSLRGQIVRQGSTPVAVTGRGVTIGATYGIPLDTDPYGFPTYWGTYPERRFGGCLVDWWGPSYEGNFMFARPGQSQVESFYANGNHVYTASCQPSIPEVTGPFGPQPDVSKGINNGNWYRYTITSNSAGQVTYTIENAALQQIGSATVQDGYNPFAAPDHINQWIVVSDAGPGAEDPWTVHFQGVEGGWY